MNFLSGEFALRETPIHRQGFIDAFGDKMQVRSDLRFDRDLIILAFTNRSGSNHLAELMRQSKKVCAIHEDLNQDQVQRVMQDDRLQDISDFFVEIVERGGEPDAAFGVKASAEQIRILHETGFVKCFNSVKTIRIRRRDRISQAVSLFVARRTRQWTASMSSVDACLSYDFDTLRKALHDIQAMESALDLLLGALQLPVVDVFYEDLCDDRGRELRRISDFLGVEIPFAEPTLMKKQATRVKDDLSDALRAQLLENWGLKRKI